LSNNTNTRICNATSNVTLNNNPDYRIRDHSNNTRTLNSKNSTPLLIYHQNIRGQQNKIDELSMLWSTNLPHVLCFTEHHFCDHEINSIYINSYNLGAKYCRVNLESAYSFMKLYLLQPSIWVSSVLIKTMKFVQ